MVTFSGYANKVGLIDNSSSEIPPMVGVLAQDGQATKTSCKWDYNPQFSIIFRAIYRVYFIQFLYRSVFWGPPCMVLMNWLSWLVKQLARLSLKLTAKSCPENGPLKTPQKEARNIFQWSIFRGKLAVSFRECIPRKILKTIFVICLMALSSV